MIWFFLVAGVFFGYIVSFFLRGKSLPDNYYETRKAKAHNTKSASGKYRIIYVDREGVRTERDISIKQIEKDGDRYIIQAHCSLRKATRTFLDHNITEAINLDTGEIVKSVAKDSLANARS
jgi:hypothetical protein